MKALVYGTAAALALLTTFEAKAAVWQFDTPTGVLGPSHIYGDGTAGDPTITALAEGQGALLTAKMDGPDEDGLGLTNSPFNDGEITPGSWISLDIRSLVGHVSDSTLSFAANSTSEPTGGGDFWHIYGSNAPGTLGTSLLTGTGDATVDLMDVIGTWEFVQVTADAGPTGNGTVLVHELDATLGTIPTPEPSTLRIMLTAMAGFGLLYAARRSNKT